MPDRYLTISDAEKFTGKSRSTLRRFIDGIVKIENAPDRHLLLPTVDEVAGLRAQNQPFSWRISEELLRRQFLNPDDSPTPDSKAESNESTASDSSRFVAVLEKSISMLERELNEKNSQIAAMNERMRESNILMKDLQQRLALPAAKAADDSVVEAARTADVPATPVTSTEPTPSSSRKSRFGWLFGA